MEKFATGQWSTEILRRIKKNKNTSSKNIRPSRTTNPGGLINWCNEVKL